MGDRRGRQPDHHMFQDVATAKSDKQVPAIAARYNSYFDTVLNQPP